MALDKLTKIDGGGISTTSDYRVGVITATKFVGPVEGSITATDASFSGNVSIAGTLTYEDVTNVDSVGLVTAREGIFIPDSKILNIGNTSSTGDLQLFSDGTFSQIKTNALLKLRGEDIRVMNAAASETFIICDGDNGGAGVGNVNLYFDNDRKFRTLSYGVMVESATGDTSLVIRAEEDNASADAMLRLSVNNNSASGYVMFGDDDDSDVGRIRYNHSDNSMNFRTNGVDNRFIISSDGNVGVSTFEPRQILHVNKNTGTAAVLVSSPTAPQIRINPNATDGNDNDRSNFGQATGNNNFVNNAVAGDTVLRGTSTGNLLFGIGTAEKLRITSDGRVGINESSPDSILSVMNPTNLGSGAGNLQEILRLEGHNANDGILDFKQVRLSSGNNWTTSAFRIQRRIDATNMGYIDFGTGSGGAGRDIQFASGNGTLYMHLDNTGNVGIGTHDPATKLHISSGTSGDCELVIEADVDNSDENDNSRILFRQDGGQDQSAIGTENNELVLYNSVTSGGIVFKTGTTSGYTNATEKVRITSAGQTLFTGVSGTTPLDIKTNNSNNNTVQPIIEAYSDNSSRKAQIALAREGLSKTNGWVFLTSTDADSDSQERLRITSDGNVGIGVDDPSAKLHVENTTGTATYVTVSQQKTYGSGTGTAERSGLNLAIREASQAADNRIFGRIEVGTNAENSSSSGFMSIFTRRSGSITEKIRITSTGRIIQSNNDENIDMDSAANGQLRLDGNGYSAALALNATGLNIYNNSASRAIIFGTNETERARITSDGAALFGGLTSQTADTSKLAVQGGDSNIGIIQIHAGGGENGGDLSGITFSHGNSNATSRAKGAIAFRCDGTGYGRGDLCFYVDGTGDNNQVSAADEKVRITSSGRVNIAPNNLDQTAYKVQIETGTNRFLSIKTANHNDFSDEGSGIFFSRQSDGSKELSGIFAHTNTSLGMASRGNLTFHAGGSGSYNQSPERLRIESDGNVGINTSNPDHRFHVYHPTTNTVAKFESGDAGCGMLFKDLHATTRIEQYNTEFKIDFDIDGVKAASDRHINLDLNGTTKLSVHNEGVRIGNSVSGTPSQMLQVDGNIYLGPNDTNRFVHSGASLAMTADSNIYFVCDSNDTSGVAPGGEFIWGGGSNTNTNSNTNFTETEFGNGLKPRNQYMYLNESTLRPTSNGGINLGSGSYRWGQIYSTSSSISTSDRNEKKDIIDCDLGLDFICKLNPVSFKWNTERNKKADTKVHYGLIAQDVEEVILSEGKTLDEFGAVDKSEEEDASMGLSYNELIAPMIKALQEANEKIKILESEVAALKSL